MAGSARSDTSFVLCCALCHTNEFDPMPDDRAPLVVAFAAHVMRWRWAVVFASVVFAAVCLAGAPHLTFSNNYRVFFSAENPQLRAFEAIERIYTKNDSVLFVLRPAEGDVFSPRMLALVHDLTERAWQIPHSTRVDSITNFQHTEADGDDLVVGDLVVDPASLTAAERERVAAIALAEPLLRDRLVAADRRTTGVNVRIHPPGLARSEISETVAHVRAMAAELRAAHADVRIELTGTTLLSNAFAEAPERDLRTLVPAMYVVLFGVMVVLLGSFMGALVSFGVVLLSAASAIGLAGWAGLQLNGVSASAPTIILTLAIADSVHILTTLFAQMHAGCDKRTALLESLRVNAQPVFLTSLTTVIGFLSLNFSDAPPMRDLGNITAVGVALAWLFSMTFLPAMIMLVRLKPRPVAMMAARPMEVAADFVVRRRRMLLLGMSLLVATLLAGTLRFEINDRPVDYFSERIDFRRATDFTVANLTGFYGMNFSLPAGQSGGITDPEYLRVVDEFVAWMRARPDVAHVATLTDTMKRLNRNLHGDDPAYYRLPEDRELAAQYLLLYEMSLPFGLDLNDQIDVDKSATRVTVTNTDIDFRQLKLFKEEAEAWLRENGLPSMRDVEGSSPAVMFAYIGERNILSMLRGTLLAFGLISLVLVVALRSLRMGLISLVPNTVPLVMAFGIWAWMLGTVDFAVSVVAGISIGIIVDDTVHFLSKYLRARRELGLDSAEAVRYAFRTVGSALWANTVILVAGFSALAGSQFWPNATMGLLTAIAIAAALVADFFLLPPLLMRLDRDRRTGGGTMPTVTRSVPSALVAVLVAASFAAAPAAAETPAETPEAKGLRIALEAERRDQGWGDASAEMRMTLTNQHGDVSERELRMQSLENPDPEEGDKTMIVFDRPRDVRGTALLTHTRILAADDQWLYLPALKRVRRISSNNKSGSFMGSEFAYEDFSSQEVAKYTYKWLRDEPCGEWQCYVVERYPQYANSGYTRQIVWFDQGEYRAHRVEYYDRKDALLKALTLSDYRQYLDRHWRAHDMRMENVQTGKSTRLVWSGYEFRTGLRDADFTPASLERAR